VGRAAPSEATQRQFLDFGLALAEQVRSYMLVYACLCVSVCVCVCVCVHRNVCVYVEHHLVDLQHAQHDDRSDSHRRNGRVAHILPYLFDPQEYAHGVRLS
jgi:hypothetical protein